MNNTGHAIGALSNERCHPVLIVDDHPILRSGVAGLINRTEGLRVCGFADDRSSAVAQMLCLKPDLVILDIALGVEDGIEVLREIKTTRPEQRVLILSMHNEAQFAPRCLRAGASGYLSKDATPQMLITAIRKVLSGGVYVSESMSGTVPTAAGRRCLAFKDPLGTLTPREAQVLKLMATGQSMSQIAVELRISLGTAATYRTSIKEKLNMDSVTELTTYATQLREDGLV